MYVFPVGACYDSSLGSVIDNSSYNGPLVIKFDSSPYWPPDSRVRKFPLCRLLKSTESPTYYFSNSEVSLY